MDSGTRQGGTKREGGPLPGTFRPALPKDAHQVVHMFAVAARAACAEPAALSTITETLGVILGELIAPELQTAQECARLWQVFGRVAKVPKETLRREAGRAFCRDLDALGQRLELAPLPEWVELPEALDEANAFVARTEAQRARALPEVQAEARQLSQATLAPQQVLGLLSQLEQRALRGWLEQLVGQGELGRNDVNLLVRQMVKGEAIAAQDSVLIEVLVRLGGALTR